MSDASSMEPRSGLPPEIRQQLEAMDAELARLTPEDRTAVLRMLFDDVNRQLIAAGLEPVKQQHTS